MGPPRAHLQRQLEERHRAGPPWHDLDLVFCREGGCHLNPKAPLDWLERTLTRAGLGKVRFHDLRHTAATLAIASGVDVRTTGALLGHASAKMTLDTHALPCAACLGGAGGLRHLFVFPLLFLAPTFAPIEVFAPSLEAVARVNPVTYVLLGMRSVVTEGWDGAALLKGGIAVADIGAVTLSATLLALRRRAQQQGCRADPGWLSG